VYVVGDEVVGAMRRYAPEGDWRTNVASVVTSKESPTNSASAHVSSHGKRPAYSG
jgi:glutathione synthase/RimK-type ligase-like ATP-grasp enzyme